MDDSTTIGPFIIQVKGRPVTKPEADYESRTQASVGSDPAIFTWIDGRLECGEWFLGRFHIEDRSLIPKAVYWFKKEDTNPNAVQHTMVHDDEGSYTLRMSGAPLNEHRGKVHAALIPPNDEEYDQVKIIMQ
ncbi:hypothetical protein N7447_004408 [Penicillium robsamsonii]|uniref:uncharacterized protein n=1 Tax=Penicillium robsamsonii TaxID=1792511 RepID=UPI002548ED9A|nr:uncharacterized protein N7447_004408 [Penicillium robsamsonii]KAJ5827645.1 hypothetical protein N7447_004408 [Penicillium robsamsonii]